MKITELEIPYEIETPVMTVVYIDGKKQLLENYDFLLKTLNTGEEFFVIGLSSDEFYVVKDTHLVNLISSYCSVCVYSDTPEELLDEGFPINVFRSITELELCLKYWFDGKIRLIK